VYVEKDGATVSKLYITSIENQDAGAYICSGVVARQRLEKNITMMLFSEYIVFFYFVVFLSFMYDRSAAVFTMWE